MTKTGRSPEHMERMRARRRPFSDLRMGPTFEGNQNCFFHQPREATFDNGVSEIVLSGGPYLWGPQELVPKQRSSGSPSDGGTCWSLIDVAFAAGADARFLCAALFFKGWYYSPFACIKFQNSLPPGAPIHSRTRRISIRSTSTTKRLSAT
jgi:hypothetical protein